jgi:hypothetical protein
MTREERTCVSIGSHSKQQEIETRDFDGGFIGKDLDELFLIVFGTFCRIGNERFIDGVNAVLWNRDLREDMVVTGFEVGLGIIEGNTSFISKENLPKV